MSKRTFTARYIPKGVTPRFYHLRDRNQVIFETVCDLVDDDSKSTLATARSRVSPKDNPCKKIGRAISLGRALKFYYSEDWAVA